MKTLSIKSLIVFLLFISYPFAQLAAEWNSFVINFDKSLFGRGAQTWQINPYNTTWTYFGNSNGLLQFDGSTWKIFQLNNHTSVRSVLSSSLQERIYVGGINEFGYFKPVSSGEMVYHCMSDSLSEQEQQIGNIWGIHEADNILYFQADGCIVKYLNGKYTHIPSEQKIDCSNIINGILYLGTNQGVKVLVGNTLFPLQGADLLANERIRGIVPYKDGIIIATAYNGLYYWDKQSLTPFTTGAEEFMQKNEVFCIASDDNMLAIGTIHKGILLIDINTHLVKYFNENNGLRNNTVLSVAFDSSGNLWAGLDNGINYLCINSPFTNLYSYPHSFGSGYTAAVKDDIIYLGTNRGLYYTSFPIVIDDNLPNIRTVPQSSGQVWDLCTIGDELFCLHDRGLFLVENNELHRISDLTGIWTCQQVADNSNRMFVGVYDGMYLFEKTDNKWHLKHKIIGLDESCRLFEQESPQILWVQDGDKIMRVELNRDLSIVKSKKRYGVSDGLPESKGINIAQIKDHIYFTSSNGIFQYDELGDKIEAANDINQLLNGATSYSCVKEYENKLISLSSHELCIANLNTYKKGMETAIHSIHQSILELIPTFVKIITISDSLFIIPNENGFALFTTPEKKRKSNLQHSVFIQSIYLTYPKDSLIYTANYLDCKPDLQINYENNSIRFEYGQSLYSLYDDIRYQYRLNKGDWSDYTFTNTKEYSNLPEGDYLFEVKIIHPDGTASQDEISFSVLAPWYRSPLAYVFYAVLAGCFLWLIYLWEDKRLRKKRLQIETEKNKELHKMEKVYEAEKERQERQIMELEKEKLQHDLQHKSQEMANLMINFVRKNEMLNEIKQEVIKVSATLKGEAAKEGKRQLMIINSKIDSNIQSDEVLKRIEEQFDLIHNNFMKRLNTKHPDLSLNERMMCAYLIMNLSTKEIAPLLNISVRGVETIRYRLRKKFNLQREDSLTEYLNHEV